MRAKADLFLLCTLCIFLVAGSEPTFTAKPPNTFLAVEGSSITLEWRYNFGGGSFRQLLFGNSDTSDIVDKLFFDKVPKIDTGYKGRLVANVTDAYTSITFLRVNRTDSTIYTLTIKSNNNDKASSKVEIGVKYPPRITVHPVAGSKAEGADVLLSCDADGNPAPMISWTRNGSPVDSSDSSRISFSADKKQFTIRNVIRTDTGEYRCVASNELGNATSAAILDVQYQPEVTAHSLNVTKPEGDNVTLSCNATGNPAPTISWLINGFSVDTSINDSRMSFSGNQKHLTITNLSRKDSGKYRCRANNILGNATSDVATLDVQYKPEITAHPQSVAKTEGDNVTLSCNNTANPIATISWTRNRSPVDTSHNSSRIRFSVDKKQLTITNVNRTDSGEYRCVASNELGHDTSNAAKLDIQYEPKITAHPQNATKMEGNTVIFSCNVTGNPVPTISWTKKRHPVNTTINSRISFLADKKMLTITNVNRVDSGEYRCVASNILGHDTSNVATLNVQYKPEITAHPLNETKTEGDNVTFTCDAIGNPVPSISWSRDGSPVETSDNFSRISFSVDKKELTVRNVSRTDRGEYRCVAENSVGIETSNAANLDVQLAPEISENPKDLTTVEGQDIVFSCVVEGKPSPSVKWTKNEQRLNFTANSRLTASSTNNNHTLTITDVHRSDAGQYRCVANNSVNTSTSSAAKLEVHFPPNIFKNPEGLTRVEGQNVVFNCVVEGNPSPSVSWAKNGQGLNLAANSRLNASRVSNNYTLTITDVHRSDAGQYRCVAINSVGSSSSSAAKLELYFQPEFISNPKNSTVRKGQNVTLECKVYGNPPPDVRWTKDGDAVNRTDQSKSVSFTGNTSNLILISVIQADQGLYRCVANNSANTTTSYPGSLAVHFVPEVMIIGDQEQFVIKGGQLLLTCQYNALPPVSEVQWEKDGAVITRNASVEINNSLVTIPHFNESQVQLETTATESQDAGRYTCLVINDIGNSSNTTSVIIQVEPSPPVNAAVVLKSSRVVNISWTAGFEGNSAIQNYTVERSLDNAEYADAACQGSLSDSSCVVSGTSASFGNLSPWTTYYFKVFARNLVGTSDGSSVVNATTDEEVPTTAPNFNVTVVNSTAVNVSWQMLTREQARGQILGHYVLHNIKSNLTFVNRTVDGKETTSYVITSLKEFTLYEFAMQAFNSKGVSPKSSVLEKKTDEDKPSAAPQNVTGKNSSSRSILVMWDEVPADEQNGIITSYTITYYSQTENDNGNVQVNSSVRQTELTNLKEYVKYYITVFASTVKGDGPASDPIVVRTDQDRPSAPPQDLQLKDTTSSSLLVGWNEVPAADKNGIIVSYTVSYQAISSALVENLTVFFPTSEVNLTGLIKNMVYSVRVLASTDKGDGNYSDPKLFLTNQDVPSAAPQNVRGHNTSFTSILVTWDEVPANEQRGNIRYYTVIYMETQEGAEMSKQVDSPKRSVELTGLKRYAKYSIQVSAATVKGDGPASVPITVSTEQGIPSKAPVLTLVTVLNSTSVEVEWQPVPEDSRHGIITKYVIFYTFEKVMGEKQVPGSLLKVVVNGLRQSATYSFRVHAATVRGAGPASSVKNATTEDPPTAPTPPDGNIGTTEVSVPFKTKKELSNGKPVSFYQMIVTTLTDEQDPGKSSDEQYVKVMRNYDNQVKGEPYITAEFANDQSRTSFPVGDGKYYSRDGVTEAKRKRRKTFIKYQNGKLEEGTRYAVFQRSFDEDGDYENEGFITFTTKDDGIPTATLVLSIVVGLLVVLIVVIVIVMWRRRLHPNAETKSVSRDSQQGFTQEILELSPYSKPSTEPSYYNTALNEPETEGQFTYEAVDDVRSGQVTHYDDVGPQQGDIYQEFDSGVHYQPLSGNRQVTYQGYVKPKRI